MEPSALMDWIQEGFVFLRPYPYLQAAITITVFLLLAKLTDWLCSRVARRLAATLVVGAARCGDSGNGSCAGTGQECATVRLARHAAILASRGACETVPAPLFLGSFVVERRRPDSRKEGAWTQRSRWQ